MPVIAASLSLLLTGCERSLIYYPTTASEGRLDQIARSQGLSAWRNAHGERIGWSAQEGAPGERPTVVVFHGNAGHAADRGYFVAGFRSAAGEPPWNVFLLEYPGYGSRPGQPSEASLTGAATQAVDSLLHAGHRPLFLVGESLGSGVACAVATAHPQDVAGLALITPFTSLRDVARHHYPAWLVGLLLRERYDNREALRRYSGRVAVVVAGADEVVPAELGRALFATYAGPKQLWVQDGRGHNSLALEPAAPWWRELKAFLRPAHPAAPR